MRDRSKRMTFGLASDEFEAALAHNLSSFESPRVKQQRTRSLEIVCLGESHGSHLFGLSRRVLPGSGALLLKIPNNLGRDLILDPGWGSLAAAHRLGTTLGDIGLILVSHCHLDHVGDLQPLLLTLKLQGQRPVLVSNPTSIEGGPGQPPVLSEYFRRLCRRVISARPNSTIRFQSLRITPFQTTHRENPSIVGQSLSYVVAIPSKRTRVGLITDGPLGELSESTLAMLRKCQVIVINIGTLSTSPESPAHSHVFDNALCLHGFELFLEKISLKPNSLRSIAVTHLGAELLEVRSPLMKDFLRRAGKKDPIELMSLGIKRVVRAVRRGHPIDVRVLREGDTLEV